MIGAVGAPKSKSIDLRPMRVGVVGTGFGARVVAPIYQHLGCEVIAVVSARDSAAVAELCRADLDLVSVHSPPFLQSTHVGLAIDAGCAVLCDKPFGTSAEEAATLAADAHAAGVINLVNFEFRHQPARVKMHELIMSGKIGRPEHFHYSAFFAGSRVPLRQYSWLFDRSRGGGWIGAFGSHAIDAMRWLMGEIHDAGSRTWVTIPQRADAQGVLRQCDAEDSFTAWFEFDSGATASIDTSFTSPVSLPPRITVTGSEGTIENLADVQVTLRRIDGTREKFDFPTRPGDPHDVAMTAWITEVWRSVVGGQQIAPSFEDGVACGRVMDLLRAAEVTVTGGGDRA